MNYRTIDIKWQPHSTSQWRTFTQSRQEAARLWNDLVRIHHRLRRLHWHWPSKARWQEWAKRKYPGLHSQSVQQIIGEFVEAVASARALRANGYPEARYPWRLCKYRDVIYTNQAMRLENGWLYFPNGKSGTLRARLPEKVKLPGRLMETRLCFDRLLLICEVPDEPRPQETVIGIDLGVNTLIAATDGQKALLISGREAKATVQWRNKRLASIQCRQAAKVKGSLRWRKLQRRKRQMLAKAHRRLNDLIHKATHLVAITFPNATCYVGKPFNDAAEKMGRKQAQQISQACNARIIQQLDYKTSGAIQVDEYYSSQTDPVCGERSRHGRIFHCHCGTVAPRDVIGATNILCIGQHGKMLPGRRVPDAIIWRYPVVKYPAFQLHRQVVRPDTAHVDCAATL